MAPRPTLLDAQGSTVAAYGGWAAWSRYDPATKAYALALRSPSGAISLAPVAERGLPFDIELGPEGSGVVAVYSRCSDVDTLQGCHIYELKLGVVGAIERMLAAPGSSVHEPAIWDGLLIFLRRNPGGGGRRPDNLFQWRIGSSPARSVALPASHGGISTEAGHWPKGQTGAISGLTLHGQQVAYSTASGSESFGVTSLWLERLGGSPKLIDQITSGASATCEHAFLSPTLLGGWLYAYLHDCDPSANPQLDRWTRYSLSGHGAQRAKFTFVHTGDEIIDSVAPDAGGVRTGAVKAGSSVGEHRLAHDQATRARKLLHACASALLSCRIPPLRALAFSSCGDDGAATGYEHRSRAPAMAGGWHARGGIAAAGWLHRITTEGTPPLLVYRTLPAYVRMAGSAARACLA